MNSQRQDFETQKAEWTEIRAEFSLTHSCGKPGLRHRAVGKVDSKSVDKEEEQHNERLKTRKREKKGK